MSGSNQLRPLGLMRIKFTDGRTLLGSNVQLAGSKYRQPATYSAVVELTKPDISVLFPHMVTGEAPHPQFAYVLQ